MGDRIKTINSFLEGIGSGFRAVSETRILKHLGGLRWIKRDFASLEEMENYIFSVPIKK